MAEEQQNGQSYIERELTCSICKEILFQPLTLLDCLHSFCGGCLKEWFAHQAAVARSIHPYTCPSCRASVRLARPNASVTTLLDDFLRDNPSKDRTEEEKKEQREKFSPDEKDNIMPKLRLRDAPRSEEDQRVMDEVMALSLEEAGITNNSTLQEPESRRTRQSSRGHRSRDASRSPGQTRGDRQSTTTRTSRPRGSRGTSREPSPSTGRVRQIEHQHSLRSILSVSELDPQEMQEDIMRQITEEGLLNDIDWNNLDTAQEEELSAMIARAYQQRREQRRLERRQREQREQATTGSRPRERSAHRSPPQPEVAERPPSRHAESAILDDSALSRAPARPPVSNPHLIQSANQVQTRHRRTGSQGPASRVDSATGANTATPSTSGLGIEGVSVPRTEGRRRMSNERRSTDPERMRTMANRPHAQSNPSAVSGSAPNSPQQLDVTSSPQNTRRQRSDSNPRPHRSPLVAASTFPQTRPSNNSTPSLITSQTPVAPVSTLVASPTRATLAPTAPISSESRPSSSSSGHQRPTLFTEPAISCDRCGKSHIEYDLHYSCRRCRGGEFNLCLPCYRSGKGCLHWYGFGWAAWQKFQRLQPPEGYPPNFEQPHTLHGRRYLRSQHPIVPAPRPDQPQRSVTEEDPARRLQDGVFCDICSAFANPCYWKCDACNEGAWGFCNDCVNQGRHCTHPLLPLKAKSATSKDSSSQASSSLTPPQQQPSPPLTPKSASIMAGPSTITIANRMFNPLSFRTNCDICTYSISPSNTRYHCPVCNNGDYDICTPCYHAQVSMGKMTADNGPQGWRRCPQGHRMVIIGFEDRDGGQRRIVQRDKVGGWALKEEDPSSASADVTASGQIPDWSWKEPDGTRRSARSGYTTKSIQQSPTASGSMIGRFPPDGGTGLRFLADWPYFPQPEAKDELMFPKGAEIREAEDINGDWFIGGYAGARGLFPGNYGRVI